MNKKYVKRIIGIILLVAVLVASFFPLQEYFSNRITHNQVRIKGFYLEKKNSLDVIVMGSSEVYYGYYANETYKNTKITSYPFAFEHNPVSLWKYELKEILKNQKPKLLVIEANGAGYGNIPKAGKPKVKSDVKNNIKGKYKLYSQLPISILESSMPDSENKRQMLRDLAFARKKRKLDRYVPFLKYHGQFYDNMSCDLSDMEKRGYSPLKGVFSRVSAHKQHKEKILPPNTKPGLLDPLAIRHLKKFIKLAKRMGVKKILFVRFPHKVTDKKGVDKVRKYLRVKKIVEAAGCDYADFTFLRDEIGISAKRDFVDREHLNANGARKFTAFLSKYIKAKYKLKATKLSADEKKRWDEGVKYIDAYYKYYNDYQRKYDFLRILHKTFPESTSLLDTLKEYMKK